MAKAGIVLFIFFLFLGFGACEKDDICVEGDTPLLVIRFYNTQDTSTLKKASKLRVIGLGQSSVVSTFKDRSNTDSIAIPLRIDNPETDYVFILNSADTDSVETGNRDTLRFTYNIKEVFISRACGYAINYEDLQVALPSDASPWVQDISIVQSNVQNQASAHVKIYH